MFSVTYILAFIKSLCYSVFNSSLSQHLKQNAYKLKNK